MVICVFLNDQSTTGIYTYSHTLSPHDALPISRYVDAIAAAGKAVKPLPMYTNASLSDPFVEPRPTGVQSGGPNWNVIPIWKAGAPHLDLVAPDIYNRDMQAFVKYLDQYERHDNAVMVPEPGDSARYARFFWPALREGARGVRTAGGSGKRVVGR